MTPKFKYDPEHNCLREVLDSSISFPDTGSMSAHIRSLRVIPCAIGSKWPEWELLEGVDFYLSLMGFAIPLDTQPRLYTQAEALEIWDGGWNAAIYYSIHDEENITKQQYFKTRFNVEL